HGDELTIPRSTLNVILGCSISFALTFGLLLDGHLVSYRAGAFGIALIACVGITQVGYQVARTRSDLIHAQAIFNGWKFASLPLVALFATMTNASPMAFLVALSLSAIASVTYAISRRQTLRVSTAP